MFMHACHEQICINLLVDCKGSFAWRTSAIVDMSPLLPRMVHQEVQEEQRSSDANHENEVPLFLWVIKYLQ